MSNDKNGDDSLTVPRTKTGEFILGGGRTHRGNGGPPLIQATGITVKHASIGFSPAGFYKVRAEFAPGDLARLIGYDPRSLIAGKAKRPVPANVAPAVVALQQQVQRSIDNKRVAVMVEYLHQAVLGRAFGDWAEIDVVTTVEPDINAYDGTGSIQLPVSADYFITDGQHRYCALLDFARQYPELSHQFTQSVAISVMPEDRLPEWAGQAFHDKNRLAVVVRPVKALAVDTRDPFNRIAKVLATHPVIQGAGGIDDKHDTVSADSDYFTSLSTLYKFVRGYLLGRQGLDPGVRKGPETQEEIDAATRALDEYLTALGASFPVWASDDRSGYLSRTSAALQALAVLGHDLSAIDAPTAAGMIRRMGQIDWSRANSAQWGGVIGAVKPDGTVAPTSARQSIDNTIRLLRDKTGLTAFLEAQSE